MLKVKSAKMYMETLNPNVNIDIFDQKLSQSNVLSIFSKFDYVLDGCDNAITRYIVNDACVFLNKVLISGASV